MRASACSAVVTSIKAKPTGSAAVAIVEVVGTYTEFGSGSIPVSTANFQPNQAKMPSSAATSA